MWHRIEVAPQISRETMTCLLERVVLGKMDKHVEIKLDSFFTLHLQ